MLCFLPTVYQSMGGVVKRSTDDERSLLPEYFPYLFSEISDYNNLCPRSLLNYSQKNSRPQVACKSTVEHYSRVK